MEETEYLILKAQLYAKAVEAYQYLAKLHLITTMARCMK